MFVFEMQSVDYAEPWNEPFDVRLKLLLKGDTKVAYLYDLPAKNSFRYRVYNMVQTLNSESSDSSESSGSSNFSAAYFATKELDILDRSSDEIDVLVVSRVRYTSELNRLVTRLRNRGKKVFFDIDDMIFDPDYTHLIVHTLDLPRTEETWNYWFALIGRIRAAMQLCDAFITTNSYLAQRIESYFSKPTYVIPNFMNEQQLEVSSRILDKKKESGWQRDDMITLGYFSGTQTHNKDFEVAATALAQLFKSDSRVRLRIGGHLSLRGQLQEFSSRIETLPLRDFVNLQTAVGEVDINLVPLQDNVFSNCKSELKYFEAAVVGTITVASPIFSYAHAIRDGQNGYLAESYQWADQLSRVIDSASSYQEVAETAAREAQLSYSWKSQTDLIKQSLSR